MDMDLITFLKSLTTIVPQTEAEIHKVFFAEQLPKGHKLHEEGEVCNQLFYIESGLSRTFYFNEEGKDITYRFNGENTFTSLIESYYDHKPSFYTIELLEDAVVYTAAFPEFEKLLEKHPELMKVYNHVLRNFVLQSNERIVALQFHNAQERYQMFVDKNPHLLQRESLGHIASYLGITQETLSRIRSK